MLAQPGDGDDDEDAAAALAAMGGGGVVVELSAEDDEAIQRLQALGFDRNACVVSGVRWLASLEA